MYVKPWPGKSTSHITQPLLGNFTLDDINEPEFARRSLHPGFKAVNTRQSVHPQTPTKYLCQHPNASRGSLERIVSSIDTGGIDLQLLSTLNQESAALISPNTYDPTIGDLVHTYGKKAKSILFGDDHYVFQSMDAKKYIFELVGDMQSPITQIAGKGIIRTRKGLYRLTKDICHTIAEHEFIDCTSLGQTGALGVSKSRKALLYDHHTNQLKAKFQLPMDSYIPFIRTKPYGMNTFLACTKYQLGLKDLRSNTKKFDSLVLSFDDRLTEFKDISVGPKASNNIFAVSSSDVIWISGRNSMDTCPEPVLKFKQPFSRTDPSVKIYKLPLSNTNSLVTLTSQTTPMTFGQVFSTSNLVDKLPLAASNEFFVQSWPTILPRSHLVVGSYNGSNYVQLFSTGANGGLYGQKWVTRDTDLSNAWMKRDDLPPPTTEGAKVGEGPQASQGSVSGTQRGTQRSTRTTSNTTALHPMSNLYPPKNYNLLPKKPTLSEHNFRDLFLKVTEPLNEEYIGYKDIPITSINAGTNKEYKQKLRQEWIESLNNKFTKLSPETREFARQDMLFSINALIHDLIKVPPFLPNAGLPLPELDDNEEEILEEFHSNVQSQMQAGTQSQSQSQSQSESQTQTDTQTQVDSESQSQSQSRINTQSQSLMPSLSQSRKPKKSKKRKRTN